MSSLNSINFKSIMSSIYQSLKEYSYRDVIFNENYIFKKRII